MSPFQTCCAAFSDLQTKGGKRLCVVRTPNPPVAASLLKTTKSRIPAVSRNPTATSTKVAVPIITNRTAPAAAGLKIVAAKDKIAEIMYQGENEKNPRPYR